METTREGRPESISMIFDEVRHALDRQFEQIQTLNGRAQQLLGFAALVVAVLVGLRPPTHGLVSTTTFSIALALFVAVVACGYQAWAIRGWRRDPQPQRLWEHYRSWPDAWLRQQLVLNWIESYAANRERLRAKVQYIRLTQVLLGVETVYLVALTIARPYL